MNLKDLAVLMIDAQTTGMRPPHGQLLELAWTIARATDEKPTVQAHLLRLPEGESIPYRVAELTGISDADLAQGKDFAEVLEALRKSLEELPEPRLAVIHYAQFEKPFLLDLFARGGIESLPFEVFCTHQLTKRLFPNLPAQNIRGTAGFFGKPVGELKRATAHVHATADIWRGLVAKLANDGLSDLPALREWLLLKPKKEKKARYEYRLPAEVRLKLPDKPGVYRMIAKTGEILYVGKATSLKSRVNSYFRGKVGREKRKLELMAQVWDLNVTETHSPLEAALLEADEIKRHNPPYNVMMKTGKRHLVFYARDFSRAARTQSVAQSMGPFRNSNWIEPLRLLNQSLTSGVFLPIFFEVVSTEQTRNAFEIYARENHLPAVLSVRQMLAHGLRTARRLALETEEEAEQAEETERPTDADGNLIYSDEEVAGKIGRLMMRAGLEYARAKRLTHLLNARVTYRHQDADRILDFRNGLRDQVPEPTRGDMPWFDLDIETYDRMSVLLSELEKYEHRIEKHPDVRNSNDLVGSGRTAARQTEATPRI